MNEPFDGRVEILGANARDAETITVKLADNAQFERAGVLREAVLLQLRFDVIDGGAKDYIQITSREPIREPFLNFLLELNWENGRVVREYTVLLDPPLYDPMRRRPITQAAPVAKPVATPTIPAPARAATAAPAPAVNMQTPSASPAAPMAAPGSTLGVVAANDTSWSLASNNLPDASISVQQMMLALLRANPDAFGDGNINILKRGAVLRMPNGDELTALSRSEALAEVRRQHQLWNDYRGTATESVAEAPFSGAEEKSPEPMAEETPADTDEMAATDDDDARLELVAPGSDDAQMGAGESTAGSADVTLTREELDAQMQANQELQARIAEADEIIDLMRRQVDIKDDELAALQSRLAELGVDAPAELMPGADDEGTEDDTVAGETGGLAVDEADVTETPSEAIDDVDITIGDTAESDPDDEDVDLAGPIDDAGSEISMDDGGGDGAAGSIPGGLIPAHIINMVPGGAMTVLGTIGAVLLALIIGLFKLFGGRGDDEAAPAAGVGSDADDVIALTEIADDDEPITETRESDLDATAGADQATLEADASDGDVPPELQATSPDLQATIESTAEELAPQAALPAGPQDDPLEEINVYLAYERFDQAEELVRKVIAEHPDDHRYKLRLLEVYYSSNDKAAYELSAGELRDAIGEDDPLWDSAVAMWTEMSPDRALFEEGANTDTAAEPAEDAGGGFVDITAESDDTESDDAGAETMSMAPGKDSVLESTQIGLDTPDDDDDDGALDFDLGAGADGEDDGGMLDLTGGMEDATGDEMLDLTATADDDVFDLTAVTDDASADALDFTLDNEPADADVHAIGSDTSDLEAGSDEPDAGDDILDISGDGAGVDFDISDTV
ncbi:MAG: type IV pilus assembly protein FimV, partial [Gammaproteobacteria bacterium]